MQPWRPRGKQPAMSGQTELRGFCLGSPSADLSQTPAKRPAGRAGPFSDAELAVAASGWRLAPIEPPVQYDRDLSIAQRDGRKNVVNVCGVRYLVSAEEGRAMRLRMEQRRRTRPYFWAASLTPPSALAFSLGAFDRIMYRKTRGIIVGMDEQAKKTALFVSAPLSGLLWAIAVVLVVLCWAAVGGKLT